MSASFPSTRLRRNRATGSRRELLAETRLHPSDFIYPLFVQEAAGTTEIAALGIRRYGIEALLVEVSEAKKLGVTSIALFPYIDEVLKGAEGIEALKSDNLICRAIAAVKKIVPDMCIFADVALDPYTTHGHDGVIGDDGDVDNDTTLEFLAGQALTLAAAGADYVAPSDMMDGRVAVIRAALDAKGYKNTGILSYAVKYASNFYGPFREAVGSAKALGSQGKQSYQMDYRNGKEALREAQLDISEGADGIMIKPAMLYLDIIARLKAECAVPVFAYQVSGEYAMLRNAIQQNILPQTAMLEALISIKRAGADAIFTYAAKDIVKQL